MTHLPMNYWYGYAGEERPIEIMVTSTLAHTDITAATLHLSDQPPVSLTPASAAGGYKLTRDPFTMPAAGLYRWEAFIADDTGHDPVVVAVGLLTVEARIDIDSS